MEHDDDDRKSHELERTKNRPCQLALYTVLFKETLIYVLKRETFLSFRRVTAFDILYIYVRVGEMETLFTMKACWFFF